MVAAAFCVFAMALSIPLCSWLRSFRTQQGSANFPILAKFRVLDFLPFLNPTTIVLAREFSGLRAYSF
jgi:hypothetical protein